MRTALSSLSLSAFSRLTLSVAAANASTIAAESNSSHPRSKEVSLPGMIGAALEKEFTEIEDLPQGPGCFNYSVADQQDYLDADARAEENKDIK